VNQATSLFVLLESLVFELGQLSEKTKQIGDAELKILVDKFFSFACAVLPVHEQFRTRNEVFILKLFQQWSPDVMPIIRILSPYAGMSLRHFDGTAADELHKKLCAVALPNFARQILTNFRQAGFIERLIRNREDTGDARRLILDANGPLWTALRSESIQVFSEAASNLTVRENAYEMLHWFVLVRAGQVFEDQESMKRFFSNQPLFDAVWNAAIATPLSTSAVYRIKELPDMLGRLGVKFNLPPWWQQIMATYSAADLTTDILAIK
jgi:hypothetical protein